MNDSGGVDDGTTFALWLMTWVGTRSLGWIVNCDFGMDQNVFQIRVPFVGNQRWQGEGVFEKRVVRDDVEVSEQCIFDCDVVRVVGEGDDGTFGRLRRLAGFEGLGPWN